MERRRREKHRGGEKYSVARCWERGERGGEMWGERGECVDGYSELHRVAQGYTGLHRAVDGCKWGGEACRGVKGVAATPTAI